MARQAEFTVEITENIGVYGLTTSGWTKEINLVSWNGAEPVYDIRAWSADHNKCGKGATLSRKEIEELYEILGEHLGYNEDVE